jgi:hypothetical protein
MNPRSTPSPKHRKMPIRVTVLAFDVCVLFLYYRKPCTLSSLSNKNTGKESACKSHSIKTSQWSALSAGTYTVFLPEREDLSTPLLLCCCVLARFLKARELKCIFLVMVYSPLFNKAYSALFNNVFEALILIIFFIYISLRGHSEKKNLNRIENIRDKMIR